MLLSQILHAGERDDPSQRLSHRLSAVVERELGGTLAQEEQKSDWGGPLPEAQLASAAKDAAVLLPLWERLRDRIDQAGLEPVAAIRARGRMD